jgi:Tfp pilus assembly PilM family ATPase
LSRFHSPTATQRLSRLVRAEGPEPNPPDPLAWDSYREGGRGMVRLFSRNVRHSIGVEISAGVLRLAKVRHIGGRAAMVTALRAIPVPENSPESADLGRRLRTELKALASGADKPEVWAVARLESAEMNLVTLPAGAKAGGEMVFYAVQDVKSFDETQTVFDYQRVAPGEASADPETSKDVSAASAAPEMVGVLGFTADRAEVAALERRISDSGFPLTGLCPYPLAFQNLIQAGVVDGAGRALCRLYVSETSSRIDVFSGGGALGLSRTIRSSVSSMVDVIRARLPAALAGALEAERVSVDRAAAREAFFAMLEERSPDRGPVAGFPPGRLLELLEKPLQRLVWQVERTIEAYAAKLETDPVATLCVAGAVAHSSLFRTYLSRQIDLELSVQSAESLRTPGRFWPSAGEESAGPPPSLDAFEPAIGIALSALERTPNFLFPFREKIRGERGRRIQKLIWGFLLFCTLSTVAGFYWQRAEAEARMQTVAALKAELDGRVARQDGVVVDRALIELQVARLREEREAVRAVANRYRLPAAVGGLTLAAPESVFFSKIIASVPPAGNSDGPRDRGGEANARIVAHGHVLGERETAESDLLRYLAVLREEAMFPRATLEEKRVVDYHGEPAIQFVVQVDFGTVSET